MNFDAEKYANIHVEIYTGAPLLLLVKLGWFVFSFMLHQKYTAKDISGVKKMIKIGSYIIGSVQVGVFALYLVFGIILIAVGSVGSETGSGYKVIVGGIMTPIGGFFLVFSSLLLHGIRKNHSRKIKAWIMFKCVFIGLLHASIVRNMFLPEKVWQKILGLFLYALTLLYCSGMVILHYNILLDDENLLGSAINNLSNGKDQDDDQKKLLDDPPAYSQAV